MTTSQSATTERDLLRRVAVAGFAAANIMLLSVSVWSGGAGDMSPTVVAAVPLAVRRHCAADRRLRRHAVLQVSTCKALSKRRLNMDVPISLGVCCSRPA